MTALAESLKALALTSPRLMLALRAARDCGLQSWCIGAGAVRDLVWDHLHGRCPPSFAGDVDLVYFDSLEPPEHDREIQQRLRLLHPDFKWDVANQAYVHLWYEQVFGHSVAPLRSLEEGIATWPEYATCVGLRLAVEGGLEVLAPHGLDDLFGLQVRHNPARAGKEVFVRRCSMKRWIERWPKLRIVAV